MENCHAFDDFSPQGLLGSSSDINFSYKEQQFNLNLLSDDGLLLIIHRQQRTARVRAERGKYISKGLAGPKELI